MGVIVAIISGVVGLLAICGFLISYGVWKGRTDRSLEQLEKRFERHDSEHRTLGGTLGETREEMAETRGKLDSITKESDR